MMVGKHILWRLKGKTCPFATGVISQYRLDPARIEIVPEKGRAYGVWVHIKDIEMQKGPKGD